MISVREVAVETFLTVSQVKELTSVIRVVGKCQSQLAALNTSQNLKIFVVQKNMRADDLMKI